MYGLCMGLVKLDAGMKGRKGSNKREGPGLYL